MDISLIIAAAIGGAIGFAIAWLIKNNQLKLERKTPEEQESKFKSLALDILRQNSEDFLKSAQKDLGKTKELVDANLANKEKDFEKIVKSVNESVESLKERVNKFEKERSEQFGALGENIGKVLEAGSKISKEAATLKDVLSFGSAVRGRWGERFLKDLLEESGLIEGINFRIQETIPGEESSLRPDVIINLPGESELIIDSKASLEEFFKAIEANEAKHPEAEEEHMKNFISHLKSRVKNLSSKEYQKYLDQKIPYVVMFIPSEAAVRAALQRDMGLYREAQEMKVMLASPTTIMPLILLIAYAWKQNKSALNAVELGDKILDLGDRLKKFFTHVSGIGSNLSQTTKKFNEAVGSFETKVLPQINRINDLGSNLPAGEEIKKIEEEPRLPKKLTGPKNR